MTIHVTINIFSGRPNPSWEINDEDRFFEFQHLFAEHREALAEIHSGYVGLGFRGLAVQVTDGAEAIGLPRNFEVAGGGSQDPSASAYLAEALLNTMPADAREGLSSEFPDFIRAEIRRTTQRSPDDLAAVAVEDKPKTTRDMRATSLPDYMDPDCACFWNSPKICQSNVCYNFALNYAVASGLVRVGCASSKGYSPSQINCVTVTNAAIGDGLSVWPGDDKFEPGKRKYKVALYVQPQFDMDYHWYRLCKDETWWHKIGSEKATNLGDDGKVLAIDNFDNHAHHTKYPSFCGYFQTKEIAPVACKKIGPWE